MLTDISLMPVEYICYHMRDVDKPEIYGIRPHDNPLVLAWEATTLIQQQGRGKVSWVDGKPAALAAFTETWPGMWEVWMFGTDDFSRAAFPLLKWVRTEAKSILSDVRGHRLQCDSRADHHEAHKMIKAMGAREEVVLRKYGKDGADYIRFVWFNGENDGILNSGHVREIS